MLRVVFMGTPEFAVGALEAVAKHHSVVCVYSQGDKPVGRGLELKPTPVKAAALRLGLPVHQPEKLSPPEEVKRLRDLKPDVLVVVAYGKILRREVLDVPRLGCVNIHASLLPRWRGASPIQSSILGGDAESGVTTMRLVEELDAGDILLQKKTPLAPEETSSSLHDRLALLGAELIVPTLAGLEAGSLRGVPQDSSQVTYAPKLTKDLEHIDPKKTALQLDREVRALNPWPGTSVRVEGQRLKIKRAKLRSDIQGPQGQIFERSGMILLGTSAGSLELLTLQWDGKKEVDAAGFLNGIRGAERKLPLTVE